MAAIAYPTPHPRQVQVRPSLRLVRGAPRPSDAVYRRRRLAATLLLAVVLLAVTGVVLARRGPGAAPVSLRTGPASGALVDDPAAYGAGHRSPPPGSIYVVQPGDTLWTIARELVPAGDVRDEVDRLAVLNGSAALQAGQRLQLAPPPGS
jgi:LysM repeat protein